MSKGGITNFDSLIVNKNFCEILIIIFKIKFKIFLEMSIYEMITNDTNSKEINITHINSDDDYLTQDKIKGEI
jgi:hypothetical protein